MKNIHVLPTDKSSRLVLSNNSILTIIEESNYNLSHIKSVHIYITSNEEIKEGVEQWYLDKVLNEPYNSGGAQYSSKQDVIILTTDQDLIKDGIQAIDDEFLEWFVKNPSCEFVDVEEKYRKCCRNTDGKNENCIEPINCEGWLSNEYERPYKTTCDKRFEGYKIIIPKEELHSMDDEVECNMCGGYMYLLPDNSIYVCTNSECTRCYEEEDEEPKQETMEYDLLQHIKFCLECKNESQAIRMIEQYGFEMQEQDKNKFSEEDMIAFGNKMQLVSDVDFDGNVKFAFNPSEAIKQFKNK